MKKVFLLALASIFLASAIGCGAGSETVESKEDKTTIGNQGKKGGAMESENGLKN